MPVNVMLTYVLVIDLDIEALEQNLKLATVLLSVKYIP